MIGFEFGCRGPLAVRHEVVPPRDPRGSRSSRAASRRAAAPWRLLYASDLHLGARRRHVAARVVEAAAATRPDLVLLGGDLVDRAGGLPVLRDLVSRLRGIAPVHAVAGNHDAWVGLRVVRAAVHAGGGTWLAESAVRIRRGDRTELTLHGEASACGEESEEAGHRVLVGHHPTVAERRARSGAGASGAPFDVTLAGHLHGGQCVLWRRGRRLYPGAWFSRWTGTRFELPHTTLLVSRGAADTLPVRFRCPREVLLVELR